MRPNVYSSTRLIITLLSPEKAMETCECCSIKLAMTPPSPQQPAPHPYRSNRLTATQLPPQQPARHPSVLQQQAHHHMTVAAPQQAVLHTYCSNIIPHQSLQQAVLHVRCSNAITHQSSQQIVLHARCSSTITH